MEQGMNVRVLNEEEKCELISALANAKVNNNKKAKTFKSAAQDAHHKVDASCLADTAERSEMWAQLDESLIEAIINNDIVIKCDAEV